MNQDWAFDFNRFKERVKQVPKTRYKKGRFRRPFLYLVLNKLGKLFVFPLSMVDFT